MVYIRKFWPFAVAAAVLAAVVYAASWATYRETYTRNSGAVVTDIKYYFSGDIVRRSVETTSDIISIRRVCQFRNGEPHGTCLLFTKWGDNETELYTEYYWRGEIVSEQRYIDLTRGD